MANPFFFKKDTCTVVSFTLSIFPTKYFFDSFFVPALYINATTTNAASSISSSTISVENANEIFNFCVYKSTYEAK